MVFPIITPAMRFKAKVRKLIEAHALANLREGMYSGACQATSYINGWMAAKGMSINSHYPDWGVGTVQVCAYRAGWEDCKAGKNLDPVGYVQRRLNKDG
jgi:hypothetical protein